MTAPPAKVSDAEWIRWFNTCKKAKLPKSYPLRPDTAQLWIGLYKKCKEIQPVSVRGMFYQMEIGGLVPKSEAGYKQAQENLVVMRRTGIIPYSWITDGTRWVRKPKTYENLYDCLEQTHTYYRRALWSNQEDNVEVWIEKDALIGVIYPVTTKYDVPVYSSRGYSSISFLHSAAEGMNASGKTTYIYYMGDHDPSGVDISRSVEKALGEFGCDFEFERIAVNLEQIRQYNLPTRPTKKSDSRSKKWKGGDSVELDALHPEVLRSLIREKIEYHIDPDLLAKTATTERLERETLDNMKKALLRDAHEKEYLDGDDE